jgi:hypothetical protein
MLRIRHMVKVILAIDTYLPVNILYRLSLLHNNIFDPPHTVVQMWLTQAFLANWFLVWETIKFNWLSRMVFAHSVWVLKFVLIFCHSFVQSVVKLPLQVGDVVFRSDVLILRIWDLTWNLRFILLLFLVLRICCKLLLFLLFLD